MKKLMTFFVALFATVAVSAQCVIDTTNTAVISPSLDSIPCVERTVNYGPEVIQIKLPASFSGVTVDSMQVDSITGLPSGITWTLNPVSGKIYGGGNACAEFSGLTSAPAMRYDLTLRGMVYTSFGPLDLTNPLVAGNFSLYLDVIEPGGNCRDSSGTVSVKNIKNAEGLNVSMYPNPNNGVFTVSVNNVKNSNVEVVAYDFTGKRVFANNATVKDNYLTQVNLSNLPKGIYAVQVKTANGIVTKNVLID
jgi:hypothetical protein